MRPELDARAAPLVEIDGLEITFPTARGEARIVDGVSLSIAPGEFFGLIGETGAGKSITAWAAMGLVPPPGRVSAGSISVLGHDVRSADEAELREIRGRDVAIIVQNARAALNPMTSIGAQIATAYRAHNDAGKREAFDRAVAALASVGIPDPSRRARSFPHELSGGMAQRALIALAMVNDPKLLIADEPTTGLDVTIQAEILDLMEDLVASHGSSIWLITHDLAIIANHTTRAAAMFAGQIVETAPTADLFADPRHPYTRGLIEALSDAELRGGERLDVGGGPPNLVERPRGCQFAYRCPLAEEACTAAVPDLSELAASHLVRCVVAEREARETVG
jgi:oligopeptide/dipeptide ABC transporter ATP-binding protein